MSFLSLLADLEAPRADDHEAVDQWSALEKLACGDLDLRVLDEKLDRLTAVQVPLGVQQRRAASFWEQITR